MSWPDWKAWNRWFDQPLGPSLTKPAKGLLDWAISWAAAITLIAICIELAR